MNRMFMLFFILLTACKDSRKMEGVVLSNGIKVVIIGECVSFYSEDTLLIEARVSKDKYSVSLDNLGRPVILVKVSNDHQNSVQSQRFIWNENTADTIIYDSNGNIEHRELITWPMP